ncbi:Uncharacterized protein TCM_016755 [Theobroma cacao]|uniref:Reverse transcriptase domain-containing protein n=1 Tax=Theobroma cacao TaxID=3641 RepID=A0A061GEI3_THECC|nr:Uncharacterized protein TCM_016755 [Theobroma cacao]
MPDYCLHCCHVGHKDVHCIVLGNKPPGSGKPLPKANASSTRPADGEKLTTKHTNDEGKALANKQKDDPMSSKGMAQKNSEERPTATGGEAVVVFEKRKKNLSREVPTKQNTQWQAVGHLDRSAVTVSVGAEKVLDDEGTEQCKGSNRFAILNSVEEDKNEGPIWMGKQRQTEYVNSTPAKKNSLPGLQVETGGRRDNSVIGFSGLHEGRWLGNDDPKTKQQQQCLMETGEKRHVENNAANAEATPSLFPTHEERAEKDLIHVRIEGSLQNEGVPYEAEKCEDRREVIASVAIGDEIAAAERTTCMNRGISAAVQKQKMAERRSAKEGGDDRQKGISTAKREQQQQQIKKKGDEAEQVICRRSERQIGESCAAQQAEGGRTTSTAELVAGKAKSHAERAQKNSVIVSHRSSAQGRTSSEHVSAFAEKNTAPGVLLSKNVNQKNDNSLYDGTVQQQKIEITAPKKSQNKPVAIEEETDETEAVKCTSGSFTPLQFMQGERKDSGYTSIHANEDKTIEGKGHDVDDFSEGNELPITRRHHKLQNKAKPILAKLIPSLNVDFDVGPATLLFDKTSHIDGSQQRKAKAAIDDDNRAEYLKNLPSETGKCLLNTETDSVPSIADTCSSSEQVSKLPNPVQYQTNLEDQMSIGHPRVHRRRKSDSSLLTSIVWNSAHATDPLECLHVKISLPWLPHPFAATFVYAKCTRQERLELWNCLRSLSLDMQGPWMVGGDFNTIVSCAERLNGAPPHGGSMEDFATTLLDCGLIDAAPSLKEIKDVVFNIDKDSVAGPDGFSSLFYQHCWDIIKQDLLEAVLDFFKGTPMPRGVTSTTLVLLPKKPNSCQWSDFRPISLCTVLNKIVTKLLANRLSKFLPSIISENQSGFVNGRLISDNILLAQELVGKLDAKARGGNVVLKLDMAKAYDRLSWDFLYLMMEQFGFNDRWISMIKACISNCWFSLLINGSLVGYFKSERGLRQGDSISPLLFILAAEYLSRGINQLFSDHKSLHYLSGCFMPISHLAFADDIVIFTNGCRPALQKILIFLQEYEAVSGQQVNHQKSCFITSNGCPMTRRQIIAHTTGFQHKTLPVIYLGAPLHKGPKKVALFDSLITKIRDRISGWENKTLSPGGRITLLRSVLSSMPMYLLQVLKPPVVVIEKIERLFNSFLWGDSTTDKRMHWVAWHKLTFPCSEGGIDIRRLNDVSDAFTMKLWWRFQTCDGLWTNFLKTKYCMGQIPHYVQSKLHDSQVWKRM